MSALPLTLRGILAFDAVTCGVMGAVLSLASGPVSRLTGLPTQLVMITGLALLPITIVIALVAWRPGAAGVRIVVLGNALWVCASLAVLAAPIEPTVLGTAFVLAQAAVVAVLAWLEAARGWGEVPELAPGIRKGARA